MSIESGQFDHSHIVDNPEFVARSQEQKQAEAELREVVKEFSQLPKEASRGFSWLQRIDNAMSRVLASGITHKEMMRIINEVQDKYLEV